MPKVVYLTGAPAAGKSSTTRLLEERVPQLDVWEYGARLMSHVQSRFLKITDQNDLRRLSAQVITSKDVADVDAVLLSFVKERRGHRNVIIDSHPVTKESFGYRITPFSLEQFVSLAPDEIWMLYTDPEIALKRIAEDPGGRPSISIEQARMHTALQASVAATYGMALGIPVHLFDSGSPQETLVDLLAERLQ